MKCSNCRGKYGSKKTQFIQCLFTEGKLRNRFLLKSDSFLEGDILDDRISLTYYPGKDLYANQDVSYEEIAEEIQRQIEQNQYLTQREVSFYQSVGKEFCTPWVARPDF